MTIEKFPKILCRIEGAKFFRRALKIEMKK